MNLIILCNMAKRSLAICTNCLTLFMVINHYPSLSAACYSLSIIYLFLNIV